MAEVWKDIKGYEGLYQVSNQGRIKSLRYRNSNKTAILKTQINSRNGYVQIVLSKNNIHKTKKVHRLVAEAFLINLNNYPCINHKDENRQNNNIKNLEWCTYSYNNVYNGRSKRVAKIQGKEVKQLDKTGNVINVFESTRQAGRVTGYNQRHISECCRGLVKTCGGYIWEYTGGD